MVIDLNSDLGEGFGAYTMGDDAALLDVVTSANVACGFHGGDPVIMRRTCDLAVAHGVRIGAHISYRDLAGFGRREMAVSPAELTAESIYQIGALDGFARAAGDRVRYVKPHGALYHSAASDPEAAEAVVAALLAFDELSLLGPADSELARAAEAAGISFHAEGFADRAYTSEGRLVPRGRAGAVLAAEAAIGQALSIAVDGHAHTVAGEPVRVEVRSLCVHGDSPDAIRMARSIRQSLLDKGVELRSFT
ncbi:LamB/YcsF family protein [Nocardia africana]|uniref:5-oxoprolinase subunit A n=1 Tax=Nocardia africana TaxID=134964 RepID=A0A378WTM9_9NOCA|nr:5-oxoprolinase subunit PxpA [Nocardia africana]MCC3313941.1 LamB/YcsF family protein [Nocardia africana]SUA44670.1 LamB/YcsF family protein [Nocardia africana]